VDSVAARRVAETLEALMIAPVLRPIIDDAGMLGDYELDSLARSIAQNDRNGFAALIAARLQQTP
jgi:hypothetical protein